MLVVVLLNLVLVLVGVAFVTLMERSILGYVHIRKGPASVGVGGVVQPFSDAIKLFVSSLMVLLSGENLLYMLGSVVALFLFLLIWVVYPMFWGGMDFLWGLIYFFCISSGGVYVLFLCGWSSGSLYSMIGSVRGVVQMISYEIGMIFVVMSCVLMSFTYDFSGLWDSQVGVWYLWIVFPIFVIWLVSCLAETNRSPFDFSEGESELVSGFNIEYGGVYFAFIFMAEYGIIMMMAYISVVIFMGGVLVSLALGWVLVFLWIWVRGSYPRFRYDSLMMVSWCVYLPTAVNYVMFVLGISLF